MRILRIILRGIIMTILLLLSAALFYILIIMGDSPEDDTLSGEPAAAMEALASLPQPRMEIPTAEAHQVNSYFNDSVLWLSAAGWTLDSVTVSETSPKGVQGIIREVKLCYTEASTGSTVEVSSLTPAKYISALPARGFHLTAEQDWILGSMRAVFMKSGDLLHLHAQQGDVVYQVEGPVDVETLKRVAYGVEM